MNTKLQKLKERQTTRFAETKPISLQKKNCFGISSFLQLNVNTKLQKLKEKQNTRFAET